MKKSNPLDVKYEALLTRYNWQSPQPPLHYVYGVGRGAKPFHTTAELTTGRPIGRRGATSEESGWIQRGTEEDAFVTALEGIEKRKVEKNKKNKKKTKQVSFSNGSSSSSSSGSDSEDSERNLKRHRGTSGRKKDPNHNSTKAKPKVTLEELAVLETSTIKGGPSASSSNTGQATHPLKTTATTTTPATADSNSVNHTTTTSADPTAAVTSSSSSTVVPPSLFGKTTKNARTDEVEKAEEYLFSDERKVITRNELERSVLAAKESMYKQLLSWNGEGEGGGDDGHRGTVLDPLMYITHSRIYRESNQRRKSIATLMDGITKTKEKSAVLFDELLRVLFPSSSEETSQSIQSKRQLLEKANAVCPQVERFWRMRVELELQEQRRRHGNNNNNNNNAPRDGPLATILMEAVLACPSSEYLWLQTLQYFDHDGEKEKVVKRVLSKYPHLSKLLFQLACLESQIPLDHHHGSDSSLSSSSSPLPLTAEKKGALVEKGKRLFRAVGKQHPSLSLLVEAMKFVEVAHYYYDGGSHAASLFSVSNDDHHHDNNNNKKWLQEMKELGHSARKNYYFSTDSANNNNNNNNNNNHSSSNTDVTGIQTMWMEVVYDCCRERYCYTAVLLLSEMVEVDVFPLHHNNNNNNNIRKELESLLTIAPRAYFNPYRTLTPSSSSSLGSTIDENGKRIDRRNNHYFIATLLWFVLTLLYREEGGGERRALISAESGEVIPSMEFHLLMNAVSTIDRDSLEGVLAALQCVASTAPLDAVKHTSKVEEEEEEEELGPAVASHPSSSSILNHSPPTPMVLVLQALLQGLSLAPKGSNNNNNNTIMFESLLLIARELTQNKSLWFRIHVEEKKEELEPKKENGNILCHTVAQSLLAVLTPSKDVFTEGTKAASMIPPHLLYVSTAVVVKATCLRALWLVQSSSTEKERRLAQDLLEGITVRSMEYSKHHPSTTTNNHNTNSSTTDPSHGNPSDSSPAPQYHSHEEGWAGLLEFYRLVPSEVVKDKSVVIERLLGQALECCPSSFVLWYYALEREVYLWSTSDTMEKEEEKIKWKLAIRKRYREALAAVSSGIKEAHVASSVDYSSVFFLWYYCVIKIEAQLLKEYHAARALVKELELTWRGNVSSYGRGRPGETKDTHHHDNYAIVVVGLLNALVEYHYTGGNSTKAAFDIIEETIQRIPKTKEGKFRLGEGPTTPSHGVVGSTVDWLEVLLYYYLECQESALKGKTAAKMMEMVSLHQRSLKEISDPSSTGAAVVPFSENHRRRGGAPVYPWCSFGLVYTSVSVLYHNAACAGYAKFLAAAASSSPSVEGESRDVKSNRDTTASLSLQLRKVRALHERALDEAIKAVRHSGGRCGEAVALLLYYTTLFGRDAEKTTRKWKKKRKKGFTLVW